MDSDLSGRLIHFIRNLQFFNRSRFVTSGRGPQPRPEQTTVDVKFTANISADDLLRLTSGPCRDVLLVVDVFDSGTKKGLTEVIGYRQHVNDRVLELFTVRRARDEKSILFQSLH